MMASLTSWKRAAAADASSQSQIVRMARVTRVPLCATDVGASAGRTTESKDRRDVGAAPVGALLIEGCNLEPLQAVARRALEIVGPAPDASGFGFYRHEYTRLKSDDATG
mgnify:CR=1 FL=1